MVTAQHSAVINRPIEDVFSFVTDATNDPKWHTDVMEAQRISEGPIGQGTVFRWILNYMGPKEGRMVLVRYDPPKQAQLQAEAPVMGVKPTITYLFEPSNGGTLFTRQVELETLGLMRLMGPMMRRRLTGENAQFINNLKGLLETS